MRFFCVFFFLLSFFFRIDIYAQENTDNTSKVDNSVTQLEKNNQPNLTTPPEMPAKESLKPDPTAAVAGGVGEKGFKAPDYAVLQTGKTLPKGVFKLDSITAYTFGNSPGFNAGGNRVNNGLNVNRWITGAQLQYGLSNAVSIGVGVPTVLSNHLNMDGATFAANTGIYQKYYNQFANQAGAALSAQGGALCGGNNTPAGCANFITSGGSLPPSTTVPVVLPTGESFVLNPNSPLRNQIQNILLQGVAPADGAVGMGDIQMGFLWNVISEESPIRHVPLYFSIGGGLRLPTGKFNLPAAMRATSGDGTLITGGGTYDAILRWNLDYIATPGFILSWQSQMENSLTGADLTRTSALDPQTKNTAWPNYCNSLSSCGDGVSNDLYFTRKGIHYIGFLQAAWGVGNIAEKMKWLGLYTQAKYNIAAQAFLNGEPIYSMGDQFFLSDSKMHPDLGREQSYSSSTGFKISGLPYHIPLELAAEFEVPFAGNNRLVAPMNIQTTLSLFFK